MESDELDALLSGSLSRFRSLRMDLRHWADRDIYLASLERHAKNAAMARRAADVRQRGWPSGKEKQRWRLWLEYPQRFRLETKRAEGWSVFACDGSRYWSAEADAGVSIGARVDGGAPALLTAGGTAPPTEATDDELWLHTTSNPVGPLIGELLNPMEDLLLDLNVSVVGAEARGEPQHADRTVLSIHVVGVDWGSRGWPMSENLWIADDYLGLVDAQVGVLLRWACRLDGEEFSVREVAQVGFDEPLAPTLFQAPH